MLYFFLYKSIIIIVMSRQAYLALPTSSYTASVLCVVAFSMALLCYKEIIISLRVLSTLVAREWKSTTMLTSQFLMASSSRIQ